MRKDPGRRRRAVGDLCFYEAEGLVDQHERGISRALRIAVVDGLVISLDRIRTMNADVQSSVPAKRAGRETQSAIAKDQYTL